MEYAAQCRASGNLASTRQDAAAFLDNPGLVDLDGATSRQNVVARWTSIGDAYCAIGDLNMQNGTFAEAVEAWLCALTAFEVTRRLIDEGSPQRGDVSTEIERVIQRLNSSLVQKIERINIACFDQVEVPAYYLRAASPNRHTPAVICISMEQESAATLLGRLLPVVIGQGLSVLVISHDDISSGSRSHSNLLLSCCLDYLSRRPDVDARRIGVYGEELSAVLATDFAACDRRLAAAVCDGGLWHRSRNLASVGWMTGAATSTGEHAVPAHRTQRIRLLKCPVLVVAGGRGIVSVSEAVKLQAECMQAHFDLQLVVPRMIRNQEREIENFVSSDDCIFGWLKQKLTACNRVRAVKRSFR